MPLLRLSLLILYSLTLGSLSLFGLHRLYLLYLLRRHGRPRGDPLTPGAGSGPRSRSEGASGPPGASPERIGRTEDAGWPVVTVQIPIYNEATVAPRLVEAVARLDYPQDRLEIQVLDDSADDTQRTIAALVDRLHRSGHDIQHRVRRHRRGFKAGALREGLRTARGELIAIFDADFVPATGFLREVVPSFADPRVGMVQARWGHLNRRHSWLTRVQALLLDGHFLIEQAARHAADRFFNFNGTAGVWRRRCIEDAGGWHDDTLTEDLDISYRAQLAGWKFIFLPRTVAPAELPAGISAFKGQQHRWAKGSVQTARKLLPRILASSSLPWRIRLESLCHLTSNFGHVLMVMLALLFFPAMLLRSTERSPAFVALDLGVLLFSTLAYWIFFAAAAVEAEVGGLAGALATMPALMAVGVGLSVNNARAVLEGLSSEVGPFERTPKSGRVDPGSEDVEAGTIMDEGKARIPAASPSSPRAKARATARAPRYSVERMNVPWVEGALAVYFTLCLGTALWSSLWWYLPFLLLFWSGFTWVTLASFQELARTRSADRTGPL